MNSGATVARRRRTGAPAGPVPFAAWRTLLADCRRNPTKRRVHLLRVAALRLQAHFTSWLDCLPSEPLAALVHEWNEESRHLRRNLGYVRTCDVFLAMISEVRTLLEASPSREPGTLHAGLRHLKKLEDHYRQRRSSAAKHLLVELRHRSPSLNEALARLESGLGLGSQVPHTARSRDAFTMFNEAVRELAPLDAERLHAFRKRIKRIRYLAEPLAGISSQAARLALAAAEMQSSIGQWHDRDQLAREAARILPAGSSSAALVVLLETRADEALDRALALCRDRIRQLLAPQRLAAANSLPPKKPVCRAEALPARSQALGA